MNMRWPVKILLVHPKASFLRKKKLTIAADCTILLNKNLSNKFRKGETVIIGCPLLENPYKTMDKLALVIKETTANEIEVYTMEVPCCHALHMMVMKTVKETNKENISVKYYIVRVMRGNIEPYKPGVLDKSMIEAERKAHGNVH